jgi:hypothetical protein
MEYKEIKYPVGYTNGWPTDSNATIEVDVNSYGACFDPEYKEDDSKGEKANRSTDY